MRKIAFTMILVCMSLATFAGWTNLNTGINDNLTGVVFWGSNGMVCGSKGLYYTTTGGNGPASWMRFNIAGNHADSVLYNSVKFTHAYSDNITGSGSNTVYACGYDTVNNKAIIMRVNFPAMTYSVVFNGTVNTRLNRIGYCSSDAAYYAVGNNGLVVRFTNSATSVMPSNFTHDLTSVHFSGNKFSMGTTGNLIYGESNFGSLTYTVFATPSYNHKDVNCTSLSSGYSVGNSYYKTIAGTTYDQPYYDFGPLNATSMISSSSSHFVGTDHGIFRSGSTYYFLEWQPSSLNYQINGFWNENPFGAPLYACGNNGVVLSTTDNGGNTKPLAKLNLPGACLGVSTSIGGMTGSSTNCQWYINNVLEYNGCGSSFSKTFSTAGQYTVQLNVANSSGLYDTAVQVINVVNYPAINKPVSISKNVLCHQEPVIVTVGASQIDVFYKLKKFGSSTVYGTSGNGNSATISFPSSTLSVAGNYYLEANSALAACAKNFTDTIKINVEKTLANFHTATLNASIGEPVINYQTCNDAQNYLWSFNGGSPDILSSSITTPTVSYNTASPTTIKLICWSNNGCYDTLEKAGPNIFVEPLSDDSCWTMVNNAPDPSWQGHYDADIAELSPSRTGFFACGTYFNESFASRYGDSVKVLGKGGAYIAKYDFKGALKWMNYSVQSDYDLYPGFNSRDEVTSVKEDQAGNVYICGSVHSYFYDNKGDSLLIGKNNTTPFSNNLFFIARLDSTGKFLWRLTGAVTPRQLVIDRSGNLIVHSYVAGAAPMEFNGVPTYTITNPLSCNTSLMKISPSGTILWDTKMNITATNFSGITGLDVDKNSNVFVAGVYEYNTGVLYSPGASSLTLVGPNFSTQGGKSFLLKYDSLGNIVWKVRAATKGAVNGLEATIYSMVADEDGNTYITGKNSIGSSSNLKFIVYNADGSADSTYNGQYFTMKVNKNGILKWVNSTQNVTVAFGNNIEVHGNEVSSLGFFGTYALPPTATFNSQNGINTTLTMGADDYFILVYDTLGNLNKLIRNGNNPHSPQLLSRNSTYMYRAKANGDYYIGECLRYYGSAPNSYSNFNTIIPPTNGWTGAITKFSGLNCAVVTYPNTVTNLQNKDNASYLSVYPNPAHNLLYIKDVNDNENLLVKLMSVTGQQVSATYNNGTLNIENLSPGMYFLLIYKGDKLYHQEKIIKE